MVVCVWSREDRLDHLSIARGGRITAGAHLGAAVAFSAAHPAVASVLLGMRSPAEVAEDFALATTPVPTALWHDLVAERLLPPQAHLPSDR